MRTTRFVADAFACNAGQGPTKHDGTATVVVLDDVRLTRECLVEIMQERCPDLRVVGTAAAHLVNTAQDSAPALIIINLHLERISSARARYKLAASGAGSGRPLLICISERNDCSEAVDAMELGLAGLVLSHTNVELLIAAIRLVIAGGRYFPPDAFASFSRRAHSARTEFLAALDPARR